MIMATDKGLAKDPDLGQKLDRAIFPGLQGGPHDHQTAAIAIALKEAATDIFKDYGKQIVKNAKALAESLKKKGFKLVGDGTENHLLLLDLVPVFGPGGGAFASEALEAAGMTANKNTIPKDPSSPFYPSGVRLGTPALTTRGMKEPEMEKVGEWIARAIHEVATYRLPVDPKERATLLEKCKAEVAGNQNLKKIHAEIRELCKKFPIPESFV
jgi:glycine hydroxymethyltransferase